ncbi:hypothetical protein BC629DRAFT_1435877 [Irpex lacteus]|nr:hypothetical protein BC629DRAFT_1435877 [Irpex lacteus]
MYWTFRIMFYIWRIWCLSRRAPIAIYLVSDLCFALASFAISVVMDLSVTAAFSLSLNNNQVLAHTRNTKNIIHKLMNYALSTGILAAITSVTTLILTMHLLMDRQFDVFKLQVHFGGTLMLITKVYANSMLAMLNIRQGIKRGATLSTTNGFSVHLSNFPEQTLTPSTIKVEVAPSLASDMTIDA